MTGTRIRVTTQESTKPPIKTTPNACHISPPVPLPREKIEKGEIFV